MTPRRLLQRALLRTMALLGRLYVKLHKQRMTLEIRSVEYRPAPPQPTERPRFSYTEWLEACYQSSPSANDVREG